MLTDAALRNLKPKSTIYRASDWDCTDVPLSPSGTFGCSTHVALQARCLGFP
jgi:hypothetical protein